MNLHPLYSSSSSDDDDDNDSVIFFVIRTAQTAQPINLRFFTTYALLASDDTLPLEIFCAAIFKPEVTSYLENGWTD